MVGLAKSNLSLSKTVAYNQKPGSDFFYSKNMDGEDIWDYRAQMADLQKCYRGGGKSLTLHVQLSPSIEDGKVLTEND